MKKWFFLFLSIPVFFAACKKSSDTSCVYTKSSAVSTSAEKDSISNYLSHQSITAIEDTSGVFYTIDSLGTGITASGLCSILTVKYSGYLLGNTTPFDAVTDSIGSALDLGALVVGWQRVMPLIKAGSKVTLYIPPSLAYGGTIKRNGDGDIIIPANSYLKFNIELLGVH